MKRGLLTRLTSSPSGGLPNGFGIEFVPFFLCLTSVTEKPLCRDRVTSLFFLTLGI